MDTEVKKEEVLEPKTFFDEMNFGEIFRVKGKKGLFTLASKVHKSGMVRLVGFLEFEKVCVVNQDKLVCLGNYQIITEAGHDNLMVSDVFNNLYNFYKANVGMIPILADFAPNYDEDEFKERHAFQLITWFDEIITKLEKLDETKKETKGEN